MAPANLEPVLIGGSAGTASVFLPDRANFRRQYCFWQESLTKYGGKFAAGTAFSPMGTGSYFRGYMMDQSKFNEMMETWLKEQRIKPPSDWSADARNWAVENGFIQGDVNGQYNWKAPMTREELARILHRQELGAL